MTTDELIAALREADPSGEREVIYIDYDGYGSYVNLVQTTDLTGQQGVGESHPAVLIGMERHDGYDRLGTRFMDLNL